MSALPGSHLCFEHQGNHSHYAPHNCVICKQAEAIKQLRDALIAHQKAGLGNSTDYKTQHAAYMNAHKALAATENL